MQHHVIQ